MYKRKFWPILLALIMTLAILVPAQVTQAEPNLMWVFEQFQDNGNCPRLADGHGNLEKGDGWVEGRLFIDGNPAPAGIEIRVCSYGTSETMRRGFTDSRGEFQVSAPKDQINDILTTQSDASFALAAFSGDEELGRITIWFDKNQDLKWNHVRGEVTINFVDEAGETLDSKTIVTRKYKSKDTFEFFPDEPAIAAPELSEGYAWKKDGNQAPDIDENNQINVAGITGLANSETWTYKMVKTEVKGVLHLVFVDKNGNEIADSPINVATTQNTEGKLLTDKITMDAPQPAEGYEWVPETEGAAKVNAEGQIDLYWAELENDEVTWTYKMVKTPVKGVLHLIFLDENGVEVAGSRVNVPTTENEEGKFLPDQLVADAPELPEGYKWVAEEGAVRVNDEGYVDLYWAELENDDVTWTYTKTATTVPEVKGVLHLVFVDENGKEVKGSPINVATTKNAAGKFLTDETIVKAPKLADGYEWVAKTKGAAKVNNEGKIDLYWVELDEDDVTWTYAMRNTEVTPVTPPEKPEETEEPEKPGHESGEESDKPCESPQAFPPQVVPWTYDQYAPWRVKQNATAAPKTATKGQTKTEAKVDSAKLASPAVTNIPATGEARVPLTTIGVLLLAATALIVIRRKTR